MKKYILLSILLVASLASHAQGFEWVSTYSGPEIRSSDDATNRIIGSCVDSSGNTYILGEFSPQAQLCGESLLPFDIITTPIQRAVVIAKLSQSGELLWHKAIYNGKVSCYAYALRMVGDSSIMAMVHFDNPYFWSYSESQDLYYLDTLITGNSDYLMPRDSVGRQQNGFITFDFDGNVTEQHFVCVGYTDSIGNVLTPRFMRGEGLDRMSTNLLSAESFNIDTDGNIYVIRSVHADYFIGPYDASTNDYRMWGVDDGTIGAMRIAVDGTHFLKYEIPHPTSLCNQQILKFSPHFDSLLGALYMFDSTLSYNVIPLFKVYSFEMDAQNNLYVNMDGHPVPNSLRIANSNSLSLSNLTYRPSWILKYNSDLEATGLVHLSYESPSNNPSSVGILLMYPDIDNNTNSLFVPGVFGWTETMEHLFYNDDTLDFANQTSFWLRLNKDDLSLLSYGKTLPVENGRGGAYPLAAYNNRVFAQVKLMDGMNFGDMIYNASNRGDYDCWLAIWDYSGHEVGIINHYNVRSIDNVFNSPIIKDSILYLTGSAYENVTFGDITTQNHGNSQAFIAKYVDPAFAQPYVHPSDRQEQFITWNQELSLTLSDSPVALTATSTSGLPITYTCNDSSIAYSDGSMLYLLRNGTTTVTASQQGDSDYLPAEPVTKTLQVNDVGTDVLANSSPQIFPNPTSGMVTIDLAKTPPATPLPPKQPRRGDTSDINMVLYTSPGAPFSQTESANFPYHQRYNMKVSGPKLQSHDGIVTAWLTDMQGRREEVLLTPTGPDRYTLDLTSRPPAAYLLTVTTADGRELTFRLMKQYGRK